MPECGPRSGANGFDSGCTVAIAGNAEVVDPRQRKRSASPELITSGPQLVGCLEKASSSSAVAGLRHQNQHRSTPLPATHHVTPDEENFMKPSTDKYLAQYYAETRKQPPGARVSSIRGPVSIGRGSFWFQMLMIHVIGGLIGWMVESSFSLWLVVWASATFFIWNTCAARARDIGWSEHTAWFGLIPIVCLPYYLIIGIKK